MTDKLRQKIAEICSEEVWGCPLDELCDTEVERKKLGLDVHAVTKDDCYAAADRIIAAVMPETQSYSGISWSGFNLTGDKRSIDEVSRLIHIEDRAEALQREVIAMRRAAGPVMPETPSEDVIIASKYALRDFDRDLPTSASEHAYRAIRAALAREQSK